MAFPTTLTGTWDELTAHAHELRQQGRLRLLVLPEPDPANAPDDAAVLDNLFAQAAQLQRTSASPHSDPQEAELSELIAEKFRRQELTL